MGGGFATGFFGSVGDKLQEHIKLQREKQQAANDRQAAVHWDAINSGRYTVAPGDSPDVIKQKNDAFHASMDQIQKLQGGNTPVLKPVFDKFRTLGAHVMGHNGPAPGSSSAGASDGGGGLGSDTSAAGPGLMPPPGQQAAPAAPAPAQAAPESAPPTAGLAPPPNFPQGAAATPTTRSVTANGDSGAANGSTGGSVAPQPLPKAPPAGTVAMPDDSSEDQTPTSSIKPILAPPPSTYVSPTGVSLPAAVPTIDPKASPAFNAMSAGHPHPQTLADESYRNAVRLGDYTVQNQVAVAKARAIALGGNRMYNTGDVTLANAAEMQAQGAPIQDLQGNDIDISSLPQGMVLRHMMKANGQSVYVPRDPEKKVVIVDNNVIPEQMFDLQNGVSLGQRQIPTTTTHTAPGINPIDGSIAPVTTVSTRTPQGGGSAKGSNARGAAAGRAPAPLVPAPPTNISGGPQPSLTTGAGTGTGTAPAIPAVAPANPAAARKAQAQSTIPSVMPPPKPPKAQGIPFGAYNTMSKKGAAAREAGTSLFGSPETGLQGLDSYATIADDPKARQALGQAFNIYLKDFQQHVESSGGIMALLKTEAGLPQAAAAAEQEVRESTLKNLTPAQAQAFNATLSAASQVIALRAFTGASAAQFSYEALKNDLPLIGFSVKNSAEFYDKMSRLAQSTWVASKSVGPVMSDAERDYYKAKTGEMVKRRDAASGLPAARSTIPPPPGQQTVDDQIMQAIKATKVKK